MDCVCVCVSLLQQQQQHPHNHINVCFVDQRVARSSPPPQHPRWCGAVNHRVSSGNERGAMHNDSVSVPSSLPVVWWALRVSPKPAAARRRRRRRRRPPQRTRARCCCCCCSVITLRTQAHACRPSVTQPPRNYRLYLRLLTGTTGLEGPGTACRAPSR